jgi:hypothetical protein
MAGRTGLVIGVIGLVLAIPGTLVALDQLGQIDLPGWDWTDGPGPDDGNDPDPGDGCGFAAPAEVTLSTGQAPRGSEVTVYGTCFEPGERVVIRVHVTEVGSATADTSGGFTQVITIPDSAPPPGFPSDISATGRSSAKTGSASFSTE